jgi:hypothetical protein
VSTSGTDSEAACSSFQDFRKVEKKIDGVEIVVGNLLEMKKSYRKESGVVSKSHFDRRIRYQCKFENGRLPINQSYNSLRSDFDSSRELRP